MSLAVEVEAPLAVTAVDLTHRYAPGRGLEPVSFALAAPEAVAVTGPNGSGKSTLLKILAGLLRASGGTVEMRVAGNGVAPAARRLHVGFASPELTFYEELTVAENLGFVADALGVAEPDARVRASLERFGLGARVADRVAALSSGMRQRLRLAFAVLRQPPILLLDEPGSHLDDEGRRLLERLIDEQRRFGLVMIATNDEREWRLAERRIELRGSGLGHTP
jgi:heme exporter protein A